MPLALPAGSPPRFHRTLDLAKPRVWAIARDRASDRVLYAGPFRVVTAGDTVAFARRRYRVTRVDVRGLDSSPLHLDIVALPEDAGAALPAACPAR